MHKTAERLAMSETYRPLLVWDQHARQITDQQSICLSLDRLLAFRKEWVGGHGWRSIHLHGRARQHPLKEVLRGMALIEWQPDAAMGCFFTQF